MAPNVSNPTPNQALALLPKLNDADADLRYMSLNDLCDVLNAGGSNFLVGDYHSSAKIIDGVLMTLDDQNGEVQNQAIKWQLLVRLIAISVSALVLKLPPDILSPFVHRVSNIKTTNSVDSSIPATALRTFITAFPRPLAGVPPSPKSQDAYSAISRVLIPRLLGYIVIPHGLENLPSVPLGMLEIGSDNGANTDAVDVMIEVIRCFGPMLQDPEKQAFQTSIMSILDDGRTNSVVKKKAVVAISLLAVYFPDRLLSVFVTQTAEAFRDPQLTLPKRRLLITMVGSLSRSIPQRLGQHLKTIAPFVLNALSEQEYESAIEDLNEDGAPNPEVEEVREAGLVALEGFLASCSNDMRPFTNESIDAALRYVVYDPNTAMDEDDDEMDEIKGNEKADLGEDGFDDDEADFEEDEAMSDDDDASWKIRRCAAKALYAIISTRSNGDLLDNGVLYGRIAPVLINRFREREENVRLEILSTLASLIRKTGEGFALGMTSVEADAEFTGGFAVPSRKRRRVDSNAGSFDVPGMLPPSTGLASPTDSPSPISGPKADLAQLSPAIVRGIAQLLRETTVTVKQAAISLLRDLVLVQHGGLSNTLGKVIDSLVDAVTSSGTSSTSASASIGGSAAATGSKMRIETLQLLSAICDTHASRIISPHIGSIVPSVITAIKDKNYKVSSEALLSVESIIKILTPPRSAGSEQQRRLNLGSIYDIVLTRTVATDADLEVRQRAIHALAILLARTSGSNNSKLLARDNRSKALGVLQDRLKNETTRIFAVNAIDIVAASAREQDDLAPGWVREVVLELGAQLRKADRRLRGASLTALRSLVANPVIISHLDDQTIHQLSEMLLPLLNASNLNLLGLSLTVLEKLVQRDSQTVVDSHLNSALCEVVLSSIGGSAFDAYLDLVGTIGAHRVGKPLMQGLLQNVGVSGDPAIVGKAIGTLLVCGSSTVGVTINDFTNELRTSKDSQRKCLALAILGEAGLRLGSKSPLEPNLFTAHFTSKSESVPRAAAIAIGRAGAGNIHTYLPVVLSNSEKAGNLQYLSLHSIKEILQYANKAQSDLSPYTKQIWEKLLSASQLEDNKAIGAECMGRLTIVDSKTFLPMLQSYLQDPVPVIRGMVIQAIRFTFAESDEAFDETLKPVLMNMLTTMLNDANLENRRLGLGTLNSATINKPDMVLPYLGNLIPLVMKETRTNPDLIREVQMGPFRHKVDDGLELRKSAYETLYSLMEHAYTRINPRDVFDRVIAGIEDVHEIKVLCNLMVTKLIVLDPDETYRRLDHIADRYRAILSSKPSENAVKQEVEKAAEASKGVLKVSILLHNAFPAASASSATVQGQAWKGYWEWISKEFKNQLASVENEVKVQTA
ncbi:hypothetical protein ACLMJK_000823 [Lecanora helva]